MSPLLDIALLLVGGVGHVILWTALVNRLHALAIPVGLVHGLTLVCWSLMTLILSAVAVAFFYDAATWTSLLYLVPCALLAVYSLGRRVVDHWRGQPHLLLSNHTHVHDVADRLGHRPTHGRRSAWVARLPGNQLFQVHQQHKTLALPRLPVELDGLTVAHLSDFHISGRLGRAFYEHIVEMTNAQQPDLVAVTGDLFDTQSCVQWGAEVLGALRAPRGVYFIFGNHDQRVDAPAARRLLGEHGLVDVGSRWMVVDAGEGQILLAGNELPWFAPAAEMRGAPAAPPTGPPRVLLSHAPDQIDWARRHDFDLMLAGHTHGGQIRLPLLGPVVAPSRLGTQYASGVFHLPPTVLHVSRGVSSFTPLRWNCPPELAILTLRCEAQDSPPSDE